MPAVSQKNQALTGGGAAASLELAPDIQTQLLDQEEMDAKKKKVALAARSGLMGMGSDGYGAASILGM